MSYSLNALYGTIGISKQAVSQYEKRQTLFDDKVEQLLVEAEALRRDHPGCGIEKMYHTLKPDFIGRDRFVEMMMDLGYRLQRKRNHRRTTYGAKVDYPNLIKGLEVDRPGMVWQSDITYIRIAESFYYAVFLMDVYTRYIVGYQISDNLRAEANLKALKHAFGDRIPPDIHHSDRGSQYIYALYLALLKAQEVKVSMGLSAQDNAYVERVHRTIKEEYLDRWGPKNFNQLKRYTRLAVDQYNTTRPHDSLGKMSPKDFESWWTTLKKEERPILTIFDDGNLSKTGQH